MDIEEWTKKSFIGTHTLKVPNLAQNISRPLRKAVVVMVKNE
ncbi:MAG: hypothetical protein ACI86C_001789 [Candidatus Latescibacterota bacterium]|jgi:hypothetical protein